MKIPVPGQIAVGCLTMLAIAGCTATSGHSSRPANSADTNTLTSADRDWIDFNSSISHADRPTAIVGIYGETVNHQPRSSGFGDGATNLSQTTFGRQGEDFDPDLDSDGKRIVFASTQHRLSSDIYMKSTTGTAITQLTSDPADDMMPDFSPDGEWIAFTSNRSGNWDVYIMPSTGGQAKLITTDPEHEIHPSWSPDGRRLVYCKFGQQSQRWEMWTVEVTNAGVRKFLDYGFLPQWSPDPANNKILFQRARERGSRYHSVWTIDYTSGESLNPTEIVSADNAAVINPAWAPDGNHIVFATVMNPNANHSEKPDQSDLWVVRLDGSGRTRLTSGTEANFQPTWAPNGRIYFVSNRAGTDNLWSVTAQWATDSPNQSDVQDNDAMANVPTSSN